MRHPDSSILYLPLSHSDPLIVHSQRHHAQEKVILFTASAIMPKRKSFNDILNEMDEEETRAMMAEVDRLEAECIGFRHATPSTQHRQDAHLRAYRAFIRCAAQLEPNASDSDTDALAWPADHEKLRCQLTQFLPFMFVRVRGRGSSDCIAVSALAQYRDTMLF
jgi:hypothetical protein